MSLLLDALKRAEQEKLARGPNETGTAAGTPTRSPAGLSPPRNSLELQPIGAGGIPSGAHPDAAAAHSAQVVFQAKNPAPAPESRSRGMVWATIGAFVVVAVAAGAYVWYSLKSLAPQQATFTTRPRPIGAPPSGSPPQLPPLQSAPDAALAAAAGPTREPMPVPPAAPEPAPKSGPAVVAKLTPTEEAVARVLREPATTSAPVRLDRSAETRRVVPAEVSAGYDSLRQGNLAAARRNYAAAIVNDPTNVDAHLGLATVAARTGNRSEASTEYRRVLDLDSRNPTALAALAALADFSRPEALEAQLRADLARLPDSAALHFTLGNLLAAQRRWNEAQAEYYEAHRLDPGNGDVMYNLAVSIDNLGQAKLAATFYSRALEAAKSQPTQFESAAAQRRLAEIH